MQHFFINEDGESKPGFQLVISSPQEKVVKKFLSIPPKLRNHSRIRDIRDFEGGDRGG